MRFRFRQIVVAALPLLITATVADAATAVKVFARLKGCPAEACSFGEWRARGEVPVYKSQDTSSEVLFTTKRGDAVTGISGEMIVRKAGTCITNKPVIGYESGSRAPVNLKARERVSGMYFSGEGYLVGNYQKKRIEICCIDEDFECKVKPESEQWLKVKSASGVTGWTNQRNMFAGTND